MTTGRIKRRLARLLIACSACLPMQASHAQAGGFSFGVIAHLQDAAPGEDTLRQAINETDRDNLAFVVAGGIKAGTEPCSDAAYLRRKALLDGAKNGLIVSLAGSDWIDCHDSHGNPVALERLDRVRELFFADDFSFGSSRIPVMRQSTSLIFRRYAENMRWEIGNTMFATVNLPAENNHYREEAGRNSEFEDRLIANREWLQRVFAFAARKNFDSVVLFCDGDPLVEPGFLARLAPGAKRDGFIETRKELHALAQKFPGKVLVMYNHTTDVVDGSEAIRWQENVGKIAVRGTWMKVTVDHADPALFSITTNAADPDATE